MRLCGYADMQLEGYADMQVCGLADMWLEDVRLSDMWLCGVYGYWALSSEELAHRWGIGYWLLVLLASIAIGN